MTDAFVLNLNADVGEGYGAYDIGHDAALIPLVGAVNVACGMHGGDFRIMHEVVAAAASSGASIGAQPGFADLWGFGRRRIEMAPADVELLVAYQIGALQAVAAFSDVRVTHVKPHGALNNMAAESAGYAGAIARAIHTVDPTLIFVAQAGTEMVAAGEELGLIVAREGFVDRAYDDDGRLVGRAEPGAVISDPELAAARAVTMATQQRVVSATGTELVVDVDTLCIHGDAPAAVAVAEAVVAALLGAGVTLATLPEVIAARREC